MNVRRSIVRAPVALTATALALTLSSCGFEQPTDMVYNPAVGVNDQSGSVDVLNAVIVSLLNLLDEGGAQVEGEAVEPGAFITLTFVFEGAESATLDVPVVEHGEGPYEDVPVS